MINLGELRQHPDYHRLLDAIEKKVDSSGDRVLRAAKEEKVEDIRLFSGRHSMALEIMDELTVKEDR